MGESDQRQASGGVTTESRSTLPIVALLGGLSIVFGLGALDGYSRVVTTLAWGGVLLGAAVLGLAGWAMAAGAPRSAAAARVGLLVVLAHFLAGIAHDRAHEALGVELTAVQVAYLVAVFLVAPIVAVALLFTRRARPGALLLAAAMAAALAFGLYWHYVAISPDHVAHLPPGAAQGLFRWTAAALAALEAVGVAAGLWAWRRLGPAGVGS